MAMRGHHTRLPRLNTQALALRTTLPPFPHAHPGRHEWRNTPNPIFEEWRRIELNLKRHRMGRIGEPFEAGTVPTSLQEYNQHKQAFAELIELEHAVRNRNQEEEQLVNGSLGRRPVDLYDDIIEDGLSFVLGVETVWTPWQSGYPAPRPDAPWPSVTEFKEEGDERNTSGYERCWPIPRVGGNPTASWKHKQFVRAYDLDYVWPIPFAFTTYDNQLFHTWTGVPIDDPDMHGRTVYVDKNPFVSGPGSSEDVPIDDPQDDLVGLLRRHAGHASGAVESALSTDTTPRQSLVGAVTRPITRTALTPFSFLGMGGQLFNFNPNATQFVSPAIPTRVPQSSDNVEAQEILRILPGDGTDSSNEVQLSLTDDVHGEETVSGGEEERLAHET